MHLPETKINANIDVAELTGAEIMIYSSIDDQDFVARLDSRADIHPGDTLELAFDMNKAHFFDVETELRIRHYKGIIIRYYKPRFRAGLIL